MHRAQAAGNKFIGAAIFIVLEIAAVAMLKSSATLQDIWLNRISHQVLGTLWSGGESIRGYFLLSQQNGQLAEENFRLSEMLREYQAAEEAGREKDATGRMSYKQFRFIPATVTKISRNSAHNYIILNKGSEDGIKPHSGIITGKGIVGILSAVDKHYSYGLTLMKSNISVSSRVGSTGILAPLVWDGIHSDRAFLKDLSPHYVIPQNDTVYTSGFSSIFPAGIPIGVTGTTDLVDGATSQTEVFLLQDFSALRYVTIVENPDRSEITDLEEANRSR